MRRERGLVVIIAYKLGKATLWFAFAAALVVAMRLGLSERMLGLAEQLRHQSGAWALELAKILVSASTRRGLWTLTVALLADGAVSLVEGWALVRGYWWGPWLVVVATGSLLPFEVVAFVRHRRLVRALVFLVNTAIVVYLARAAVAERRVKRLASRDRLSGGPPPERTTRA